MRWLLIGRGKDGVEGAQLEPFELYARELKTELGLETVRRDALTLDEARAAIEAHPDVDAFLLMPSWAEPAERLVEWLRALPEGPQRVLLDYYAQTSSPHLAAAAHVDVYLKRQTLRDRSLYARDDLAGGFIVTDYLHRELGWDLDGWRFGSTLPAGHEGKLVSGWSLGVLARHRRLLKLTRWLPTIRDIDVHTRIGTGERPGRREWYERYRDLAGQRLEALRRSLIMSHSGRVTRRRYLLELLRSKLVVSPFGWGEVCFRDYEAAACGALLVKPSMAHVETRPDIYVDHETYAPLRWDLSDLEEVVRRYLERPELARRVAERGQRRLLDYFERGGFVADARRVADALAAARSAPAAAA